MYNTWLRHLDQLYIECCQFDPDTVHAVTALMGPPEDARKD